MGALTSKPEKNAATIDQAPGIEPTAEVRDPLNRPWPLAEGNRIAALFG